MSTPSVDIIDLLAGIAPGSPLAAVRDQRAQARENAQRSFTALLEPENPGSFPLRERYAVAAYIAQLHGFAEAAEFYGDLLGDEDPELVDLVASAASASAARGPVGEYREPGLHAESTPAPHWAPDAASAAQFGPRIAAALGHTHLLVFRPREASPAALASLVDAGFSPDDIVTLSQLISFLSFQLRAAWGLRVLAATSSAAPATASAADGTAHTIAHHSAGGTR